MKVKVISHNGIPFKIIKLENVLSIDFLNLLIDANLLTIDEKSEEALKREMSVEIHNEMEKSTETTFAMVKFKDEAFNLMLQTLDFPE